MNIKKIIALFSLCIYFTGFGQQKELAHFFLASKGEYLQEHAKNKRLALKAFVENPGFDGIMLQFMVALASHQKHIFISYETWDNFIALKKNIKTRIKTMGITHPKQQLYICNETKIPDHLTTNFENSLSYDTTQLAAKNRFTKLIWKYRDLLYFRDPVTQSTKILHPKFATTLSPLFVFNHNEWDMYDTQMGLYYLTPRTSTQLITWPIAVTIFKKINPKRFCFTCHTPMTPHQVKYHACEYKKPADTITEHAQDVLTHEAISLNCTWAKRFASLFKNNHAISWAFYFMGHGGELSKYHQMLVCALPQKYIRAILQTCNATIKTHAMYINSCYTFPERVVAIFNGRDDNAMRANDKLFNFHLFTTTSYNKPSTEITTIPRLTAYYPIKGKQAIVSINLNEDHSCLALAHKTAHLDQDALIKTAHKAIHAAAQEYPMMDQCLLPAHSRTIYEA